MTVQHLKPTPMLTGPNAPFARLICAWRRGSLTLLFRPRSMFCFTCDDEDTSREVDVRSRAPTGSRSPDARTTSAARCRRGGRPFEHMGRSARKPHRPNNARRDEKHRRPLSGMKRLAGEYDTPCLRVGRLGNRWLVHVCLCTLYLCSPD